MLTKGINKKRYPFLYEFYRLRKMRTLEGREFWENHEMRISIERAKLNLILSIRNEFGDNKKIHMPETEYNPPTPFL